MSCSSFGKVLVLVHFENFQNIEYTVQQLMHMYRVWKQIPGWHVRNVWKVKCSNPKSIMVLCGNFHRLSKNEFLFVSLQIEEPCYNHKPAKPFVVPHLDFVCIQDLLTYPNSILKHVSWQLQVSSVSFHRLPYVRVRLLVPFFLLFSPHPFLRLFCGRLNLAVLFKISESGSASQKFERVDNVWWLPFSTGLCSRGFIPLPAMTGPGPIKNVVNCLISSSR